MSNRSRYITRLFDAVSRASGDGVRWELRVSGPDIVDTPPAIVLTRIVDGKTTHMFSDDFPLLGLEPMKKGRNLMCKDMMHRRSKVLTRPCGDKRREEIMACIRDYQSRLGRSPSHSEIASAVGTDPRTVEWHLRVLKQLGKIDIIHGKSYGIVLKEDATDEH